MAQSVVLAEGTRLKCGREIVELDETATVIFPNALSLDGVAEVLAASAKEDPSMASNLNLNVGVLTREVVAPAGGLGGYDEGTALEITYGPNGERIYTTNGPVPTVVPAETTIEDEADTIVVVKFDRNVVSPGEDPLLGFSAKVATVARTIDSAAIVDNDTIELTLESAVTVGQAVTISYNSATGDIESEEGAQLQSFTDQVVDNNVA